MSRQECSFGGLRFCFRILGPNVSALRVAHVTGRGAPPAHAQGPTHSPQEAPDDDCMQTFGVRGGGDAWGPPGEAALQTRLRCGDAAKSSPLWRGALPFRPVPVLLGCQPPRQGAIAPSRAIPKAHLPPCSRKERSLLQQVLPGCWENAFRPRSQELAGSAPPKRLKLPGGEGHRAGGVAMPQVGLLIRPAVCPSTAPALASGSAQAHRDTSLPGDL